MGRADDDPPFLGQPGRHLGQRPGARAGGGIRVEPGGDRRQVGLGQPRRAAGAGAIDQAREPLGHEAADELAHRLLVVAEGGGGLGDGGAVGDGPNHRQPLVPPALGGAGAQAALQLGALLGGYLDADDLRHGGASFTPLFYGELYQGCLGGLGGAHVRKSCVFLGGLCGTDRRNQYVGADLRPARSGAYR